MRPTQDWPPSFPPSNGNVVPNAAAVIILAEDMLKCFKLSFHSVLSFTDYPFTLSIVDQNCGIDAKKFYRAMAINHHVRVLPPMRDADLLLAQGFSDPHIRYVCLLHGDALVEPFWLSRLIQRMERKPRTGIVVPENGDDGVCFLMGRQAWETIHPLGHPDHLMTAESISKYAFLNGWGVVQDPMVRIHHLSTCSDGARYQNKGEQHVKSGR